MTQRNLCEERFQKIECTSNQKASKRTVDDEGNSESTVMLHLRKTVHAP